MAQNSKTEQANKLGNLKLGNFSKIVISKIFNFIFRDKCFLLPW